VPIVLNLDLDELAGLAARLDADGRVMRNAARVAANRTVRWARVQVQRDLAARLRVPQGAIKRRLRALTSTRSRPNAALWIALRPLNLARVTPRATRHGLAAAGQDFHGGFVALGKYGGKVALRRKTRARTPLEAVSLDVAKAAGPLIEAEAWPRIQEQFLRFYRAELERRTGRSRP
jgi:hypothetical protein